VLGGAADQIASYADIEVQRSAGHNVHTVRLLHFMPPAKNQSRTADSSLRRAPSAPQREIQRRARLRSE
jgi:hypothetical protein